MSGGPAGGTSIRGVQRVNQGARAAVYCYVWEFQVEPAQVEAFAAEYGADGAWVRLFRRDPAYVRTELHRDVHDPLRFVTIDYWTSRDACLAFRERCRAEFDAIDAACRLLTRDERFVGDFEVLTAAGRSGAGG